MKKAVKIVIIVVLNTLLSLIACLFIWFGNFPDYSILKTIPVYPNITGEWKLSANSGFPDGLPGGSISFETDDSLQEVVTFYASHLVEQGWQIKKNGITEESNIPTNELIIHNLILERKIGLLNFHASLVKQETKPGVDKEYRDEGVIIFVNHRKHE